MALSVHSWHSIRLSAYGSWLKAHGSWLMAHGSWLMAYGSWLMANKKFGAGSPRPRALAPSFLLAMSHEPWGMSHEPWAMSHEPSSMHQASSIKHHEPRIKKQGSIINNQCWSCSIRVRTARRCKTSKQRRLDCARRWWLCNHVSRWLHEHATRQALVQCTSSYLTNAKLCWRRMGEKRTEKYSFHRGFRTSTNSEDC